jgi:hypothetical protein
MRSAGSFSIFWERPITLTFIGFSPASNLNIYKGIWVGKKLPREADPKAFTKGYF